MKISRLLAITALAGFGITAQATTINFLENGSNKTLGSSSTFAEGAASVTAYASPGQILYAKSEGGDEKGLGINSDPSGDHEIWGSTFIQLLSSTTAGFDVTSIGTGSTTGGEVDDFYFSTVKGVLGTKIGSLSSDNIFTILSQYQNGYIGLAADASGQNVLLATATGTEVPDGGTTAAMLGMGLTALGLIRRKVSA